MNLSDLLKILVNKSVLSIEDYELLVMRGYMFPLLDAMTEENWMEIKVTLLEFPEQHHPVEFGEMCEIVLESR